MDQFDSYDMATYTLGEGETFISLIPSVYAQRFGAAEELAIGTRYSGTDLLGSDFDPGAGSYTLHQERQLTKPGGGAWTQAAVDDVELLIKSRGVF